ncbi:MAG TPA: UDP binding domain-containing protein, partial [Hydrogenophaga sp.]|nr:UDP binding domain-containing protein [Hydrogenophaga sp.]
ELLSWGAQVVVADPWANAQEVQREYGLELGEITPEQPVDALIVAVGHNEYRHAELSDLRRLCRGDHPVLSDVKGLYNRHEAAAQGFSVFRL